MNNRRKSVLAIASALAFTCFTAGVSEASFSDTHVDGTCSAFSSAYVDKAQSYLSAVLNSRAFRDCFESRMGADYMEAVEELQDSWDVSLEAARASVFRGNNLTVRCDFSSSSNNLQAGACYGDSAVSSYDKILSQGNETITACDDWSKSFYNAGGFLPEGYVYPKPWNWRVSDLLREVLHAQGFGYPEPCPGPGSFCFLPQGYDPALNSAPYIAGICADNIIDRSPCGQLESSSRPGEVRLPAWDLQRNDVSLNTSLCQWVPSLRHRAGLRTANGKFVRAMNGGGGTVDATAAGQGAWETFHVIDLNGEVLRSGDYVQLRTPSGALLRVSSGRLVANATSSPNAVFQSIAVSDPATFRVLATDTNLGTPISSVRPVALKTHLGTYVTAENGGGGLLSVNRTTIGQWETFTLPQPRRSWLARLRSLNLDYYPRYVTIGSGGTADTPLAASAMKETDTGAFWIVDHNGGALRSGDSVSFESDELPGNFIATCANGTGAVSGNGKNMTDCAKFVLEVLNAPVGTPVTANATILLRSQQGRYVTAIPLGFPMPLTVQNNSLTRDQFALFRLETVAPWSMN